MDEQSLADITRRRFAETGWTLQTVADRSGLSVATVWALREGKRGKRPHRTTVVKLAQGLGLPAEELLAAVDARRGDVAVTREEAHLRVYRRLDDDGRTAVEALARELALKPRIPVQTDTAAAPQP